MGNLNTDGEMTQDASAAQAATTAGVPSAKKKRGSAMTGEVVTLPPLFEIPEDKYEDPLAYAAARDQVTRALGRREVGTNDATRYGKYLANTCEERTGLTLKEARRLTGDVIARLRNIMEEGEKGLNELIGAIRRLDDLRASPAEKSKWIDTLTRLIAVQRECADDPMKMWMYLVRNDDPSKLGQAIEPERFHTRFFELWLDPAKPNSLTEAPVGHGKSTWLRALMIWRVAKKPNLRCLYITDAMDKAAKTVVSIKAVMRSTLFHALYPGIRVLGREEKEADTSFRFTVTRPNWASRDPTFEAGAIFSELQGNRYDVIYGDDFVPPDVKDHPSTCKRINDRWLNVIEGRMSEPASTIFTIVGMSWSDNDTLAIIAKDVERGHRPNWSAAIDEFRIKDDERGIAIPLWPGKFGVTFLESEKLRGRTYDYKFRLNPSLVTDRIVRRVRYYNSIRESPDTTDQDRAQLDILDRSERWLSIDAAFTDSKTSSDTGIIEPVLTPRQVVCITACWYLHVPIGAVMEWIRDRVLSQTTNPYAGLQFEAYCGANASIPILIEGLIGELKAKGYDTERLTIALNTPGEGAKTWMGRNKTARLRDCSGLLENGFVYLAGRRHIDRTLARFKDTGSLGPIPGTDIAKLAAEILNYDPKRSDGVDALTQWLTRNRHRIRSSHIIDPNPQAVPGPVKPRSEASERLAKQLDRMIADLEQGDDYDQEARFTTVASLRSVA